MLYVALLLWSGTDTGEILLSVVAVVVVVYLNGSKNTVVDFDIR